MSKLSDYIPESSSTAKAIFANYKKQGEARQHPCNSLGASQIGHPCKRYLWYVFRHCCRPTFDGRMYRLFDTGLREESRLVSDLRAIGCTVHDVDESTGKQFRVEALGGHFTGALDGCVLGVPEAPQTWHVGEFKTHNAKSFTDLCKKGVEASKPQHYSQCVIYMHLTGMTRALYIGVDKDTDDIYVERIHENKQDAESLISFAEQIITATFPPGRIGNDDKEYFRCRYCDARDICWGGEVALPVPFISCRQCCHSTPTMDGNGRWVCEKHKRALSQEDQLKTCEDHLVLPGLITWAETSNYGNSDDGTDYIEFTDKSGVKFYHGRRCGLYKTTELMKIPQSRAGDYWFDEAKKLFNATVIAYEKEDLLDRYPDNGVSSAVFWRGKANELISEWKRRYGQDLTTLEPIKKSRFFDHVCVEYDGNRLVVLYPQIKHCEIRESEIPF